METLVYYGYILVLYVVFFSIQTASNGNKILTTEGVFFITLSGFYGLVNSYIYRKTEIDSFNSASQNYKKVEEMNDFIERLLPKHIVKTIGQETDRIGEKYHNVTLLYADIVGFTEYSACKKNSGRILIPRPHCSGAC